MKVVKHKDLPERMKKRQKVAHEIAEQVFNQVWNISAQASDEVGKQISGLDALSYFSTIVCDFAGRWICQMDKIRLADDSGILREELIKDIMNGILTTIGCSAEFEDDKPKELPGGIKRLTA